MLKKMTSWALTPDELLKLEKEIIRQVYKYLYEHDPTEEIMIKQTTDLKKIQMQINSNDESVKLDILFDSTGFDTNFFDTLIAKKRDAQCTNFKPINKDARAVTVDDTGASVYPTKQEIVLLVDFFNRGVCNDCGFIHPNIT